MATHGRPLRHGHCDGPCALRRRPSWPQERIRLTGDYFYDEPRYTFEDARKLNASDHQGCSHSGGISSTRRDSQALRAHAHMKMRELAYFLKQLDAAENVEAGSEAILENMLPPSRNRETDATTTSNGSFGVFHAVTGANGRFKTGQIADLKAEGLDVYNTLLSGMGVEARLGPAIGIIRRFPASSPEISREFRAKRVSVTRTVNWQRR